MNTHKLNRTLLDLKEAHPRLFDTLAFIIALVIGLLIVAIGARADDLPVKPEPSGHVRVADREFIADIVALGVGWGLDTASTHSRFSWCNAHPEHRIDCSEEGGFFDGTRDTAKIMGAWAAADLAAVVVSYEWKKHVHNKWLHPLWRAPLLIGAQGHVRAAIGNWGYSRN